MIIKNSLKHKKQLNEFINLQLKKYKEMKSPSQLGSCLSTDLRSKIFKNISNSMATMLNTNFILSIPHAYQSLGLSSINMNARELMKYSCRSGYLRSSLTTELILTKNKIKNHQHEGEQTLSKESQQQQYSVILLFIIQQLSYITTFNIQMKRICLFDVDGTLTKSRNKIQQDMKDCLKQLKKVIDIGFVGGSDQKKIREQLDEESIALSNYFFSENGLIAYKGEVQIGKQAIKDFLGEKKLQSFINYCLHYIADLDIPIKRGTFIEYRTGLINVSPIGRNCSQEQRDEFEQYDHKHKIREAFIQSLRKQFPDYGLKYSIGGQISFDVFPVGWDKTYCLRYLKDYDQIFFFGDKTQEGGNDHQIYELLSKQGRGFSVAEGPQQTIKLLRQHFLN